MSGLLNCVCAGLAGDCPRTQLSTAAVAEAQGEVTVPKAT